MIPNEIVPVSQQLSSEYTNKGKTLCAVSGSPLGNLIASLSTMNTKPNDPMSEVVLASSNKPNGINAYSYIKEKNVNSLAELANSVINYSKNYINAHIADIMEGVNLISNNIGLEAAAANIKIEPLGMPKILGSDYLNLILDTVVGRGSDAKPISTSVYNDVWANSTKADIIKCMSTSSEEFNNELLSFISTYYPGETIRMVDIRSLESPVKSISDHYTKNNDLVIYLFFSGLYAGRHPNVVFDELPEADRLNIRRLVNYWGATLGSRINSIGMFSQNKDVIIQLDTKANVIYVNKTNYQKWLGDGGTPEALTGYWLSTGRSLTARNTDLALVNKEDFEKSFKSNQKIAILNSKLKIEREASKYIVEKTIDIIKQDVKDETEQHECIKLVNEYNSKMDIGKFETADDFCRFIVCKTLGKDSDAYEVLYGITKYRKENPDASMDEAVLVSITDLITNVVFGQIQVFDSTVQLGKSVDL